MIGRFFDPRSPMLLWVAGGALMAASVGTFWSGLSEPVAWILMVLSLPLIFEASVWQQLGEIAESFYDAPGVELDDAYNPKAMLPRILLLWAWLGGLMFLRDTQRLPDTIFWMVLLLVVPVVVWLLWAVAIYFRDVRKLMLSHEVESTWTQWKARKRSR